MAKGVKTIHSFELPDSSMPRSESRRTGVLARDGSRAKYPPAPLDWLPPWLPSACIFGCGDSAAKGYFRAPKA